jgi:hypothetical protein
MSETELGVVTHYFGKIGVAAVSLTNGELAVGDTIHFKGHTADFTMTIESMRIEQDSVTKAGVGATVGLKVPQKAHDHDKVFKVTP